MNQPFGYVYRTTNLVNEKTYIGLRYYKSDMGKDWLDYLGSGLLIKQAVELYGPENFTKEKLGEASDRNSLQELEWEWIQEEKLSGRAEYNLFTGRGAGGDTFSALKKQTLEEVKKKISEGIRNSEKMKTAKIRQKEELEKRRESEYLLLEEKILESFETTQAVSKTAKKLSVSPKTVKRILDRAGVILNHQNTKGKEMESVKRIAIQRGAILSPAINRWGETRLQVHDRLLSQIEEIIEARKNLKRGPFEAKFNTSHGGMNQFLTLHGIPKKTDRLWTTDSCTYCALNAELIL